MGKRISHHQWIQRIRALGSEVWIWVLLASLLVFAANTLYATTKAARFGGASTAASSLQVNSQRLASQARDAVAGDAEAFSELKATRQQIDNDLNRLDDNFGRSDLRGPIRTVTDRWEPLSNDTAQLLGNEQAVLALVSKADRFIRRVPQLQTQLDEVVRAMSADGASSSQIYISLRQVVLVAAMARRMVELRAGGSVASEAGAALGEEIRAFQQVMDGMRQGGTGEAQRVPAAAAAPLNQANALWLEMKQDADAVLAASVALLDAQAAVLRLTKGADPLLAESEHLFRSLTAFGSLRDTSLIGGVWISILSGLLLLAALMGLYFSIRGREPAPAQMAPAVDSHNQSGLVQLQAEIAMLAEGDLTVQASATEGAAGAVAEAVNGAITRLHDRMQTITTGSTQIAASARESGTTALHLAELVEQQAQDIDATSDELRQSARNIEQHAHNWVESVEVAERSADNARQGAAVMRETNARMDAIQRQIEQSQQHIECLGQNLQEMDAMVALIKELSEQTQLLALNTAIHAAAMGESGRGLGLIAEDAQRLAQRISSATQRYEARAQTLRSERDGALIAMQRSAAEVAAGIRTAAEAGTLLEEIEHGSTNLGGSIQQMAAAALQHSRAAAAINSTMEQLRSSAAQTRQGANQAAQSLETLAQTADDLRGLATSFKLQAPS